MGTGKKWGLARFCVSKKVPVPKFFPVSLPTNPCYYILYNKIFTIYT